MSHMADPCLVAGTLVAARFFPDGGTVASGKVTVRSGFLDHPRVRRWYAQWGVDQRDIVVEPERTFRQLMADSMEWNG